MGQKSAWLGYAYAAAAVGAVAAFALGGTLLARVLPYHEWDSFAFGSWSRDIATTGAVDPLHAGILASARPLFYELQGGLWSVTGVSFTAGRILSLLFAFLLLAGVAGLAYESARTRQSALGVASLAVAGVVAVAPLDQEALAGLSDVPAAAMVAVTAWLAVRRRPLGGVWLLAVVTTLAMLTKPTVTAPLLALGIVLLVSAWQAPIGDRHWARPVALFAGIATGWIYQSVMAARVHLGLVAYLRNGTTDGLWAQRAASDRWREVARLDALGPGLRVPLGFALVYGLCRVCGVGNQRSSVAALAVALVWAALGPVLAPGAPGAFSDAESAFTFVGFAVILAASIVAPDDVVPSRASVTALFALALPPYLIWLYATPYFLRLAATAWPGLAALIALCLWSGVLGLRRLGPTAALAPIPLLVVACWMALATFDGLHGPEWTEFRSLGVRGLGNREQAMNIVLPAVQSALALAGPHLGNGRVSTSDPHFSWFLPPGRVTTTTALRCRDLDGYTVFILGTSDEQEQIARSAGGLATPEDWSSCTSPKLQQLSDGSDGLAVFAVTR